MAQLRPRISLISALLLTAIAGMAIVIVQLWREVGPLRAENRRMRAELGLLTIEDPSNAYAISIPSFEDDAWTWRIYLPPNRQYALYEYSGHLPGPDIGTGKPWYDAVRNAGVGSSTSGSNLQGEFTLEVRLIKDEDGWMVVTKSTHRSGDNTSTGGGKTSIYQPSGDWLSDRRSRITSSGVSAIQKSFEPDKPILLLHLRRPVIKDTPDGGYTSQSPQGAADGVAVWLEPKSTTQSQHKP